MYMLESERILQAFGARYYDDDGSPCTFKLHPKISGLALLVHPETGQETMGIKVKNLHKIRDPISAARHWVCFMSDMVKKTEERLEEAKRNAEELREEAASLSRFQDRLAKRLQRLEEAEPGSLSLPPTNHGGGSLSCAED